MLIRQAQVAREGGWLVLRAQVSYQGKEAECFYSVPERFADFADTVRILNDADVARVPKMIHHLFTV